MYYTLYNIHIAYVCKTGSDIPFHVKKIMNDIHKSCAYLWDLFYVMAKLDSLATFLIWSLTWKRSLPVSCYVTAMKVYMCVYICVCVCVCLYNTNSSQSCFCLSISAALDCLFDSAFPLLLLLPLNFVLSVLMFLSVPCDSSSLINV